MRLKRIVANVCILASLFSSASILTPTAAFADVSQSNNRNWMEQVDQANPEFKHKTIRDILLPGTHDTGTGTMNSGSTLAPDAANLLPWLGSIPADLLNKFSLDKSKTQNMNVQGQLNAGIRYLDLRVGPYMYRDGMYLVTDPNDLRTMHFLYSEKVSDILGSVKSFLDQNPKEVIVLDFQAFYQMDAGAFGQLMAELNPLYDMMVPESWGMDTTLEEMWQSNKRVIVYFGSKNKYWPSQTATEQTSESIAKYVPDAGGKLWDRDSMVRSYWPNTSSVSELQTKMDTEIGDAYQYLDKLHVMQNIITVDPMGSTSIEAAAAEANRIATNGLQLNWQSQRANVIMLDFFNNSDAVNIIKKLNMAPAAPVLQEEGVYLWQNANYAGRLNRVIGESSDLSQLNVGDNAVSSIKIVGPYQVELFTEKDFKGQKTVIDGSQPNLNTTFPAFHDQISSVRVVRYGDESGIFLYKDPNYQGARIRLTTDESNFSLTSLGNDQASSLEVVGNYSVTAYFDANYGGTSQTYTSSQASLSTFDDKISSVKVNDLAPEVNSAKKSLQITYTGTDSAEGVTQNITLPSSLNGTTISWQSSNASIIAANGTVTRPAQNTEVTLTATISKNGKSDTKRFKLTVVNNALGLDVASLAIGYAPGDQSASITQNITLPARGTNGSFITWTSNHSAVSASGVVTRSISGNTPVILTATLSLGGQTTTKTFPVTVIQNKAGAVSAAKAALTIGYSGSDTVDSVTNNLFLPTNGANGATIQWQSSDQGAVYLNGAVTRPQNGGNKAVALTATITVGDVSDTKSFLVTVLYDPSLITDLGNLMIGFAGNDSAASVTKNLFLPTTGASGAIIEWYSGSQSIISNDGKVNRPLNGNAVVNLLATVRMPSGGTMFTKNFMLTVTGLSDAPAGFVKCASEGETCNFNGQQAVKYGTSIFYTTKNFSAPINCGVSAFNADPYMGYSKNCYTPDNSPNWVDCADENGVCTFSGTQVVKFGANDKYYSGQFTSSVNCDSTQFGGDPLPGTVKKCKVYQPGNSVSYQAEDAIHTIGKKGSAGSGWYGTGFWNFDSGYGYIRWTFDAPSDGYYKLSFRYANGDSAARNMQMWMDGAEVVNSLPFVSTGNWNTTWNTVEQLVYLTAGSHQMTLQTRDKSGPNMDQLTVIPMQ
ncbi:peptidase inhibitor family I36 protein [Paenibacillus pasadenensis]|uniref:immunoglobulin-like domain-containing protein n=1 Tax=Paenibacillus pasadenensis TaxID=217090 RepID=UPI00203B79B6|nr:immunoglobulin-like domain-containing protein [Paenibacillus pasadenensis]MCM3748838.1 peptidase inhibitor family I36 protein [Paenibacillus pasadenensis]